jgi:hypothetical protein
LTSSGLFDVHQADFVGKTPRFEAVPRDVAMGIHKAPNKKSARIRRNREERLVSGADVLANAAERMGDRHLRISSRKRRNTGSR